MVDTHSFIFFFVSPFFGKNTYYNIKVSLKAPFFPTLPTSSFITSILPSLLSFGYNLIIYSVSV